MKKSLIVALIAIFTTVAVAAFGATYTILIKRSTEAKLPTFALMGEPLFTTDTHRLFVGTGTGLIEFLKANGDGSRLTGLTKTTVGLDNVDNTADANKPLSAAMQAALAGKQTVLGFMPIDSALIGLANGVASLDSNGKVPAGQLPSYVDEILEYPSFADFPMPGGAAKIYVALDSNVAYRWSGTTYVMISQSLTLGETADTAYRGDRGKIAYDHSQSPHDYDALGAATIAVSNHILGYPHLTAQQAAGLAPVQMVAGRTGTVTLDKIDVGLGNVDNTADANKPISTATQTALNLKADSSALALKANLASPTFTGTVAGITASMVGLGNVNNTSDANKPVSTATQTALNLKANLASPTFTGTVSGVTKTMVGLGNVDNTTDANKPISTATQTALNLKANLASPTFTGAVTLPKVTTSSADGTHYVRPYNAATFSDTPAEGMIQTTPAGVSLFHLGSWSPVGQPVQELSSDALVPTGSMYIITKSAKIRLSDHNRSRTTVFAQYSSRLVPDSATSKIRWVNPTTFASYSAPPGYSVKIPANTSLDLVTYGSPIFQAIMTTRNLSVGGYEY